MPMPEREKGKRNGYTTLVQAWGKSRKTAEARTTVCMAKGHSTPCSKAKGRGLDRDALGEKGGGVSTSSTGLRTTSMVVASSVQSTSCPACPSLRYPKQCLAKNLHQASNCPMSHRGQDVVLHPHHQLANLSQHAHCPPVEPALSHEPPALSIALLADAIAFQPEGGITWGPRRLWPTHPPTSEKFSLEKMKSR